MVIYYLRILQTESKFQLKVLVENRALILIKLWPFLTRGYARAYHELLQGLRYANESLTHL